MTQHKILPRVAIFLGATLAAVAATGQPAQAQYICPPGYYYIQNYGCAPLSYYSEPTIIAPGLGLFFGWGYRGGGWYGGGGHRGGGHGGGGHHHR